MNSPNRPNRPKRTPLTPWQGSERERQPVEITHICGHASIINIYGPPEHSAYARSRAAEQCAECKGEEARAADEAAVERGQRVQLEGGPRQRPWAAAIRQQRALELTVWFSELQTQAAAKTANGSLTHEHAEEALQDARSAIYDLMLGVQFDTEEEVNHSALAKWWIDTRRMTVQDILYLIVPDRSPVPVEFLAPAWREEPPAPAAPPAPIEPPQRTATPLPGTAPAPYNPYTRTPQRRTAPAQRKELAPIDLEDTPF